MAGASPGGGGGGEGGGDCAVVGDAGDDDCEDDGNVRAASRHYMTISLPVLVSILLLIGF